MWKDPIVDEVRAAREAYAERFGFDLRRIAKDLMKKQAKEAAGPRRKKAKRRAPTPSRTRRRVKRP